MRVEIIVRVGIIMGEGIIMQELEEHQMEMKEAKKEINIKLAIDGLTKTNLWSKKRF